MQEYSVVFLLTRSVDFVINRLLMMSVDAVWRVCRVYRS